MAMPVRVGIADDDEVIRLILSIAMNSSPDVELVKSVEDGEAAVELARTGTIDVLVLDMEMPKMNGLEALGRIRVLAPWVRVILHSSLAGTLIGAEAIRAGAAAFIEKPCHPDEVIRAVCEAAAA